MFKFFSLIALVVFILAETAAVWATEVALEVRRIRLMDHEIYVRVDAVDDEVIAANELREPLLELKINPRDRTETLNLGKLDPGTYIVSLFQDTNGNQELDFDEKGRPVEPYGLSENPILLKAPVLKDSVFDVSGESQVVKIRLRNKKRRGD